MNGKHLHHTQNAHWDDFVARQHRAHLLQLSAWGTHKAAFGWDYEIVTLTENGEIVAGALLLFRPLPLRSKMAYLPMGPYITDSSHVDALWAAIHTCARRHSAAFLKWEAGINPPINPAEQAGFKPSPQTIQPPRTILIDISDDDDAIMARMNQGTRRKIRQSHKQGIRYYTGTTPADVARFTALMQTTGERNAFGVHEPRYYELAYELLIPARGVLLLAEHDGDLLAGIMVFAIRDTAWYLYGASSDVKRNFMASYGIQWEAIQWARARGCTHYDLWGIPDEDEATLEAGFQKRSDGLWGVYGFKRGWGGAVVRSAGAVDYIYNPIIYAAYTTALKLRA